MNDRELAKKLLESTLPPKMTDQELAKKLMESAKPKQPSLFEGCAVAAVKNPGKRIGVVESVAKDMATIRTEGDKAGLIMEVAAAKLTLHSGTMNDRAFKSAPPVLGFAEGSSIALSTDPKTPVALVKEVKLSGEGTAGEFSVFLELGENSELDTNYIFEFDNSAFVDEMPFIVCEATPEKEETASEETKQITEGEEEREIKDAKEKSEILLACDSINKSLGEMKKKADDMKTEQMDKMMESIKVHFEEGVAENFQEIIGSALEDLTVQLDDIQDKLDEQLAFFAEPEGVTMPGQEDTNLGMNLPPEGEVPPADGEVPGEGLPPEDDPIAGDEVAGDPDSPLGRVEKP